MVRGTALLLTMLTGFTALVYEVAWQKYLTVLLGSDSEATAAVLGIFLGGLSYGYGLFGKVARRLAPPAGATGPPARLLRTYGLVEAGIGAYALLFPILFQTARSLSLWLPQGSESLAFAFDVALTVLLIGPPAVLMGGTIPLLTQALARGLEDATRFHALVYAFNTLGAFGGALCAGFILIPWLGLGSAIGLMGLLNLAAGALFVAIGGRGPAADDAPPDAQEAPLPSGFLAFALAALLAGFAMMTLQTVANRIGALALGASHFTFAMVVATFVLSIALGSFAVTAFSRIPRAVLPLTAWLMVAYLLALDSQIPNAPYWAHLLRARFPLDASGFYPFHLGVLVALLGILALPLALSGATLPLIFDHLRRRVGDLGLVAGRLYSWNTVGSLLGALLGGYALFFWLDLHAIYRLALLAIAAAGGILTASVLSKGRWLGVVAFVAVASVVATQPAWSPGRLSAGLFRERELLPAAGDGPDAFFAKYPKSQDKYILFHEDDPSMSVVVRERSTRDGRTRSIVNNGKSDGAIPTDNVTMGLAALIPALLAEKAERSFVIGYGTGWTVGELAALESMQEVVVAEISKAVVDAAPLFDELNRNASSSPKTRIIRSDAYRALSREEGSYDVIVSEPSNPWTAGVELLYTREFLETVRDRLAPGGVHAQWMHAYEMDEETIGIVLRTYREVFEGVGVWFARGPDLILLGFQDPERPTDLPRIQQRFERPDFKQQFATLRVGSLPALLGHELLPVGVLDAAELDFDVHTVLHPILSDRAARAFYQGGLASLPFPPTQATARAGAEASLLRRLRATRGRLPTPQERMAVIQEICRYRLELCAAHIAEWQHQEPGSPELAQLVTVASQSRDHAALMQPELRQKLATFLGDGDAAALDPAAQATFAEYFSYSAPFDLDVLDALRLRCEADPSCRERNGR